MLQHDDLQAIASHPTFCVIISIIVMTVVRGICIFSFDCSAWIL
jgi:hypothetical protein